MQGDDHSERSGKVDSVRSVTELGPNLMFENLSDDDVRRVRYITVLAILAHGFRSNGFH